MHMNDANSMRVWQFHKLLNFTWTERSGAKQTNVLGVLKRRFRTCPPLKRFSEREVCLCVDKKIKTFQGSKRFRVGTENGTTDKTSVSERQYVLTTRSFAMALQTKLRLLRTFWLPKRSARGHRQRFGYAFCVLRFAFGEI